MNLKILSGKYQIVKLNLTNKLPKNIFNQEFYSITQTADEISIVIDEKISIPSDNIEIGWRIIKIAGVLEFNLIGVIAKISKVLADNSISIFVISTFNTDYILIKERYIDSAKRILIENNYSFV